MSPSQFNSIVEYEQTRICCIICGEQHEFIDCTLVKISEHVYDKKIPPRAKLTLPDFLEVKTLSDGTYLVTTKAEIKKGTRFGPFQAEKTKTLEPSVVFSLKIFSYNEHQSEEYYLDACDENKCNWLMYISPADYVDEQNLICYQEKDEVYYVTIKDINVDEPLRVWYSAYYAFKMNKDPLLSKSVLEEPLKDIDINYLIKKQQKIMERKIWTCKFCSQIENDIVPFARHMLKHYTAQHKNLCEVCNKIFGSKKHLKDHIKFVHKAQMPTSPSVKPRIDDSSNKTHTKDVALGGPLLNDLFTDSSDLQQTELNQFDLSMDSQNLLLDNDNLNVDNLLNDNVKDLDHFNFEIDDSQKQFVCDICLKQFNKARLLIVHMKQHTGDFMCCKCLKIFCRKENLKSHICTIDSNHRCTACNKKFTLKKYLARHLQAVHHKKFRCVICNKHYYSNKELIEHNCSKIPQADKEKFMCPVCDKFFYRDIYLKRHLKTHGLIAKKKTGVVSCEICGLVLENRNSYYSHKKRHEEPSYACEICDKKFCRVDSLREHISIHLDSQVECKICSKKFKTNKLLKSHMKIHESAKQIYKCPKCDKSVKSRPTLNRHLRKCHRDRKNEKNFEYYKCPICLKKIKLKSSVVRHIRKLHTGVANIDVNGIKPNSLRNEDHNKGKHEITNLISENNSSVVASKSPGETNQLEKELEEQIDTLLNNARNNSSIQKHAVDSLVEELDIDGKMEENQSRDREVCLSIPEYSENHYQEITLDKNAYILENGTIVQPQGDSDNVVIYVLDQNFSSR